ncbi:hypothetical protein VNO80_18285 [Phaseolus coccineus]|uniref:Uncharacterized protein n=1 Tax=Phaseolus coccineus TaxID=3886 RepID=A0AAN9MDV8_PHACN
MYSTMFTYEFITRENEASGPRKIGAGFGGCLSRFRSRFSYGRVVSYLEGSPTMLEFGILRYYCSSDSKQAV